MDEEKFGRLEEDLKIEVAKIIVKLNNSREKKWSQKIWLNIKLNELKEIYLESIQFKNEILDRIEDESTELIIAEQKVRYLLWESSNQIN